MALADSSASSAAVAAATEYKQREESNAVSSPVYPEKSTNDLGVRDKRAKIYNNPVNGKTCHQCRQMTRDFTAFCKNLKKDKPCPLTFCRKCLLNRYGEKADEVGQLDDWFCPKCRGVCNCSFCRKRNGFKPTGTLSRTAKGAGFNSVHDYLCNKDTEVLTGSSKKSPLPNSVSPASRKNNDMEQGDPKAGSTSADLARSNDEPGMSKHLCNIDEPAVAAPEKSLPRSRSRKHPNRAHEYSNQDFLLPPGMPLTEVAGIELPAQDVGAALQFLEFCNAFSEVLNITKGQAECILRDIVEGQVERHNVYSATIEFIIKLLSLLEERLEKDSDAWLKSLKRCIEESDYKLDELPLDFLDMGPTGFDMLQPSKKLKIVNFLCDEVLVTKEMRNHIDVVSTKYEEDRKANKDKGLAAKKREKHLKQIEKDETANAILAKQRGTLSPAEYEDLCSRLRSKVDKAHAEVLASFELVPKKNQRSDAVRTDHVMLGAEGQIFWKLNAYNSRSNILLQDIGEQKSVWRDNWFIYDNKEVKVVEEYISSLRNSKHKRRRSDYVQEATKSNSDNPEPSCCLSLGGFRSSVGGDGPMIGDVSYDGAVACDEGATSAAPTTTSV